MLAAAVLLWCALATAAAPGAEPAHAAQSPSNPNLRVSAEGQAADNAVAPTNILEIRVFDAAVDGPDDSITVTVDGEAIAMTLRSGVWYAYVAAASIQETGLIAQTDDATDALTRAEQEAIDRLVSKAPITGAQVNAGSGAIDSDILVQVLDLDGEFKIVYKQPGSPQTVTLDLGDPDSGIALDRDVYPQNADVVATINDLSLNVDPTSVDIWCLAGDGRAYRLGAPGSGPSSGCGPGDLAGAVPIAGLDEFGLDRNGILHCAGSAGCYPSGDGDGGVTWVRFTESDRNESTFTNAEDDVANLRTAGNAPRGTSFSVTYGDTVAPGIGHDAAVITMGTGSSMWYSGQEIRITLADGDANINSLARDDFEVTNPRQSIPAIRVGDPLTLSQADSVDLDGMPLGYHVTPVSDILVLGGIDSSNGRYPDATELTVRLGGWSSSGGIGDYLPQDEGAFRGTHMINYDIGSVGGTTISLRVGGQQEIPLVVEGDGHRGTKALSEPGPGAGAGLLGSLYGDDGSILDYGDAQVSLGIGLAGGGGGISDGDSIVIDLFSFGLDGQGGDVNEAIYRLELEEDGDDSGRFVGTLEYVGLNQINVWEAGTYGGIDPFGDSVILVSDHDSVSVEYLDVLPVGREARLVVKADTPTHSGSAYLDSDAYRAGETATVTVEDRDLNADSRKREVYAAYGDRIGGANAAAELLSISIDGRLWGSGCGGTPGLGDSGFTLQETGPATGVFAGTFVVPAEYCPGGGPDRTAVLTTGRDLSVEYVDFRDGSGSTITVEDSAEIRSATGSVSLDRAVYPVPFGADAGAGAAFATHGGYLLDQGDLAVYVSIKDADFNKSPEGADSIQISGDAPLAASIIRGSLKAELPGAGNAGNAIVETGPDTGVFEYELAVAYDDGPYSDRCPAGLSGCILQGDVLRVEYSDPTDALGTDSTVTASAVFDLRSGVLWSDQTAYVIGGDMVLTLIEPDLNLDSASAEKYPLDLIEWESDAGTATLADGAFEAASPSKLVETGNDTGIFRAALVVPDEIRGDNLKRGEEITLGYADWGTPGSDYVGDGHEEATAVIYTSNLGVTVGLDRHVYTWTDRVYVTVVAPDHNADPDRADWIGGDPDYPVRVSTREGEIAGYKLVETGNDTGVFAGEVTLVGFEHDADGDGTHDNKGSTGGTGPAGGTINTRSEGGISVSFTYSEGETASSSALIRWNVGVVEWLKAGYPASGSGTVRVTDPDMNLNPGVADSFGIAVWSDTDGGGIDLAVTETGAATGVFEGIVFFGLEGSSSSSGGGGHRLMVSEGDTVTAQYSDNTLPDPFRETDRIRIGASAHVGAAVPPLERVLVSGLRAADSSGNALDAIPAGSRIQIASDLTNGHDDREQGFAYLVQVQDESGLTVSLNWITGLLAPGQSLGAATSWVADGAGAHDVTVFVWESVENPTALSPTATMTITPLTEAQMSDAAAVEASTAWSDILAIRMWSGFEPESVTDAELLDVLGLDYPGADIPEWVMTELGPLASNGLITPDEFKAVLESVLGEI